MRIYIIGDANSCLEIPVRFSEKQEVEDNEKLQATLDIAQPTRFFQSLQAKFADNKIKENLYRTSAQKIIEWMKAKFDDGELSDGCFELTIFDLPIERTVTTFSRNIKQN